MQNTKCCLNLFVIVNPVFFMKSDYPVYIGVDIPEPLSGKVKSIRQKLETVVSNLPTMVALAGSSGKGPIPPGTELTPILEKIGDICIQTQPWSLQFKDISRFPNSDIFILSLVERKPFDELHKKISGIDIPFSPIQYPYNPHCVLRAGPNLKPEHRDFLSSVKVPGEKVSVTHVIVVDFDKRDFSCRSMGRFKLGKC